MDKYISSNNCDVYYQHLLHENNPLTLVMIHGYAIDHTVWQPQTDYFQDRYSIINIDVRGHGLSRPCGTFDIQQAAHDIKNILEQENCTDFILIGLSLGGYIIQEFAFRYGGARGYIISGATPMFLPCYTKAELFGLRHAGAMLRLYPWKKLKNVMADACAITEQARQKTWEMFDSMERPEFLRSWSGVADSVRIEDMDFDAPLLVAYGDSDNVGTIKKCSQYWCGAYQDCRLVELPQASHVANLDAPDAFNAMVEEFISKAQ